MAGGIPYIVYFKQVDLCLFIYLFPFWCWPLRMMNIAKGLVFCAMIKLSDLGDGL